MTADAPPEEPRGTQPAGGEQAAQEQPTQPTVVTATATGTASQPVWRRPRVLLAAGAAAALVLIAGLVMLLSGGSRDMEVSFSLYDFFGRSSCDGGFGGYSDIGPGTDVVVRGEGGQVIGTAQLGDGRSTSMEEAVGERVGGCIWSTTVSGVPTGEDFYSVEVGDRGTQTYSEEQLNDAKWSLSLSLGGS
jgi:hypothetical protein